MGSPSGEPCLSRGDAGCPVPGRAAGGRRAVHHGGGTAGHLLRPLRLERAAPGLLDHHGLPGGVHRGHATGGTRRRPFRLAEADDPVAAAVRARFARLRRRPHPGGARLRPRHPGRWRRRHPAHRHGRREPPLRRPLPLPCARFHRCCHLPGDGHRPAAGRAHPGLARPARCARLDRHLGWHRGRLPRTGLALGLLHHRTVGAAGGRLRVGSLARVGCRAGCLAHGRRRGHPVQHGPHHGPAGGHAHRRRTPGGHPRHPRRHGHRARHRRRGHPAHAARGGAVPGPAALRQPRSSAAPSWSAC